MSGPPTTAGSLRRALDRDSPWPGLLEYREEDREFFKGRDREAEELHRLVTSHRMTLLLASSGTGKTSLVKAGLLPRLEPEILPVYLRLDHSPDAPALGEQVLGALDSAARERGFAAPPHQAGDGLWERLHRRDVVYWTNRNHPGLPLIVLDQFEELFTLGDADAQRRKRSEAFRAELTDLVEGQPPVTLKQRIEEEPAVVAGFDFRSHRYRILIGLREDYLPEMETLRRRSSSIMDSRFRLGPMSGGEALKVVEVGGHLLGEGVAEDVVRSVAGLAHDHSLEGLAVEPFLLSLVCAELNERRKRGGAFQITADLVTGSKEAILWDFYDSCMDGVAASERRVLEETLVLETGHRDTRATADLRKQGVTDQALGRLVDLRLLRSEERGGVPRVELTHDILAPLVTASRERQRRREEQERRDAAIRAEVETRERQKRAKLELIRRRAYLAAGLLVAAVIAAAAGLGYYKKQSEHRLALLEGQARFITVDQGPDELAADLVLADQLGSSLVTRPEREEYKVLIDDLVADSRPGGAIARVTAYAFVVAEMRGAKMDLIATFRSRATGKTTYGAYLVVRRLNFPRQQLPEGPTLAQVIDYLRRRSSEGSPARFVYHDTFSTSSYFLPGRYFRSQRLFAQGDDTEKDVSVIKVERLDSSSSGLVTAVAENRADAAAVWEGTRSRFVNAGNSQRGLTASKVWFVRFPGDIPNDLLVATRNAHAAGDAIRNRLSQEKGFYPGDSDVQAWVLWSDGDAEDARMALAELRFQAGASP